MKMTEVKEKARKMGVDPKKMNKTDLIRTIQKNEGYEECYGKSNGSCERDDCLFITDCLKG